MGLSIDVDVGLDGCCGCWFEWRFEWWFEWCLKGVMMACLRARESLKEGAHKARTAHTHTTHTPQHATPPPSPNTIASPPMAPSPVHDHVAVAVLDPRDDLLEEVARLVLGQAPLLDDVVKELAALRLCCVLLFVKRCCSLFVVCCLRSGVVFCCSLFCVACGGRAPARRSTRRADRPQDLHRHTTQNHRTR